MAEKKSPIDIAAEEAMKALAEQEDLEEDEDSLDEDAIDELLDDDDGLDDNEEVEEAEETPAPKKRGRPRKVKDEEPVAPKKRGRPRKVKDEEPAAPKKRGRPRKVKDEEPAAPKKRGRPRKVKDEEPAAPKKRGRPRKVKDEEPAAPKKRGRPRKVQSPVWEGPPEPEKETKIKVKVTKGSKVASASSPTPLSMNSEGVSTVKLSSITLLSKPLRRSKADEKRDNLLKESFRKQGQINPVLITEDNQLILGYRRYKVAKDLKWANLKAIVLDRNVDPDLAQWFDEETKEPISALDKAVWVRRMKSEKPQRTEREIAERLGISQTLVNHLDKLNDMSVQEKRLFLKGLIAPRPMMDLLRADPETREEGIRRAESGQKVTEAGIRSKFSKVRIDKSSLPDGIKRGEVTPDSIELTVVFPVPKGKRSMLDELPKTGSKMVSAMLEGVIPGVRSAWKEL